MAKSNSYFLIARDKNTSSFNIIDCGHTLEEIDIYTNGFNNEEELINKLISNGIISNDNVDLFIASPRKNNEISHIMTLNLLFKNSNIVEVAKQSINKKLPSRESDDIINNFCYQMEKNPIFFDMVACEKTKLYSKFTDYFINKRFNSFYEVKYQDGCWVRKSYTLIRNIIDSYNIYNKLNNNNYKDISNSIYRDLIENKLLDKLNGSYSENQLSLFDTILFSSDNISEEDKKVEVLSTLDNLEKGVIGLKDNKISVITDKMYSLDKNDLEQLETLLDSRLITALFYFLSHKNRYLEQFKKNELHSFYENLVYEDYKEIANLLKNENVLNNAYLWVKIYNKYLGDVNGYQRRKEDNRT